MSWSQRITHPRDVLKAGDGVRVAVLAVSPEKRKISLSLKALAQNPWATVAERYQPEMVVSGAVTRIMNYGAFVQLEEGVEGLIHISELGNRRVRSVNDVLDVGQVIQVRVLAVDGAERRISLTLKGLGGDAGGDGGEEQPKEQGLSPDPKRRRIRPLRGGLSW